MLNRSLDLFAFRGIRIEVHASWLFLGLLVASSLAAGWLPAEVPTQPRGLYWFAGTCCAFGLLVSIALHELAHALVGRRYGMSIQRITLFLFGGMAQLEDEPKTPKAELSMALAGPIFSLIFSLLFWTFRWFLPPSLLAASFSYLASMNLMVALFNLLPGFPMDGGRVIRALVWYSRGDFLKATKVATTIGQGCGVALAFTGLYLVYYGFYVSGLWSLLLGLMLIFFARGSYRQTLVSLDLEGKPITFFVDRHPATVSLQTPISIAAHELVLHREQMALPVVDQDERLIGCVRPQSLGRFPPREWALHQVAEIVEECPSELQIDLEWDAHAAMNRMTTQGVCDLFVMNGNRLLGLLSQAALIRYLRLRHA